MKLLTVEEVAGMLRVSEAWVKDRTRKRVKPEDAIPCIRLGRLVRFSEQAINDWIAAGCKTVASPKIRTMPSKTGTEE